MALFDVDTSANDRGTPAPNTHDNLAKEAIMSRGTNSVNYITPATNLSSLQAGKNGQFTIVQVGNFTTTSTYTVNSPGAGNFVNSYTTIYQVPHNLPITPAIFAYEQTSQGLYSPMPYTNFLTGSSTQAVWYVFEAFVDNIYTYINLNVTSYGVGTTFNPGFIFKWYLCYQTSN